MQVGTSIPTLSRPAAIVTHVQLSLTRLSEKVHRLSVIFFYEHCGLSRSVDFDLIPCPTPFRNRFPESCLGMSAQKPLIVADVYPLNGTVKDRKFKITDYVRPIHRKEIQQQLHIINEVDPLKSYLRCLVIDFKDMHQRYDSLHEISCAEQAFVNFFRIAESEKNETQALVHRLIKEGNISFFINEGSLKANLLKKALTAEQGEYFQKHEEGSQLLCQLCEIIMNGFKQSCDVVVNGMTFNSADYIATINNLAEVRLGRVLEESKMPPFIKLITLYPSNYKETYSINSAYYQLITKIYRTFHEDKNDTTVISIE